MTKALATKNVAAVVLAFAMIVGFAFAFATPAKADSLSDLQAQVQALLAQIASLQGGSSSSASVSSAGCYTFTQNLKKGSTGGEVKWVQQFLNNHGAQVAASGAGSPGNETSTFGPATAAAAKKFQEMYKADILTPVGLTAGTGNWGASTRAKANALCAGSTGSTGSTGGTTVPSGPGISVSAGVQPANSLAPAGAERVPFTTFKITNNSSAAVTINGVNVMRTGLADDAVFNNGGVVLIDENGTQLGVQRTLNSDHTVVAGDPFVVNPGQTKTITVAGNMNTTLTAYSGEVVSLSVTGIQTSAPVSGALPISGASQTINSSLSVGTVTPGISSFDPNSAQTKNIGDMGVKFTGLKLTAGSAEDLKLYSVRFRLNGSISSSDLSNMVAMVDGTSYPMTVSADGRYYTVNIPGGLLIQKGFTKDLYIQGDISGSNASGRIVEFDIDRRSDVYVVGQTYGYGIQPDTTAAGSFSNSSTHGSAIDSTKQPWFQGSTVSVSGASVTTIGKANEVPAANVSVNVPNQVLGGFATDLKGEGITVTQMVFTNSSSTMGLTNVTLVDENGAVVAGPRDQSGATVTFTNSVNFPVGRHVYTLKGKIPTTAQDGVTFHMTTVPSSGWTGITGMTTGNSVTLTSGTFDMNTMTIRAATLAASVSASPAAQTITPGSQNFTFANIQLDASQSGEDLRVANLPTSIQALGAASLSELTGCRVMDGATALTTGSNVISPSASSTNFVFDNSITVAKGSIKTLGVQCNVSSNAANGGKYQVGLGTVSSFNATGITSSNSVSVSGSTFGGQQMTVGTASLAVSIDPSSPSAVIAAGGTTGMTLGVYKFRASNDSVNMQKIALRLTQGAAADVSNITLWSGSTQIGSANFTSATTTAFVNVSNLNLVKDQDTVVTVKGDVAGVGSSLPGGSGDTIKVDVESASNNTYGVSGGGSQTFSTGSSAVAGVRIYRSFPTVADDSGTLSATGAADGKLARFKVTANAAGSIGVDQVSWSVTASNATVNNVKLYAFSDSSYSTAVSGQASDGLVGAASSSVSITGGVGRTKVSDGTNNTVQVSAGQTVYFELRGDVVPSASASIVTKILGDASSIAPSSAASAETSNFVWTPNTLGTSVPGTNVDFVNGANVVGLPSAGFTKARGL
jgi:hypothetical protein